MDAIADFFRASDDAATLDDRTWNDLLLDDVFADLDRTQSSVGQQLLYHRLRRAPAPPTLEAFDALATRFADDPSHRERAQVALAGLRNSAGYYLHRLTRDDAFFRPSWHIVFPIWTAAVVTTVLLGVIWHGFFLLTIAGLVINVIIRAVTARRVGAEAMSFRQMGPLIAAAQALVPCHTDATADMTGAMHADLVALRRLGAIARWLSRGGDSGLPADLVGALIEYVNIQLLMDVNALYFASHELRSRAANLLRLIQTVGEIDAAIAVASWRLGAPGWSRPHFVPPTEPATMAALRHPLVDHAVPNSVSLAPPHGVLITGSNMSGKSTFLRTVGVNTVLAQTINTCVAERYAAPVYHVRTCIGRGDDLLAGKSYYLVEVESVLALVNASQSAAPHLFMFDELFRGTNAVERIAAGEAVLRSLVEARKPHVVLAATHDGELVDLLQDSYVVYHFGDAIGPNGLVFDYHLTEGPATSRNAITLLTLSGAPATLVNHALHRAAELDGQRSAKLRSE